MSYCSLTYEIENKEVSYVDFYKFCLKNYGKGYVRWSVYNNALYYQFKQ